MLKLIYDSLQGTPYRDGEAKDYADAIIRLVMQEDAELTIEFATDNILHQLRVAIKEKELDLNKVKLYFRRAIVHPDLGILDYEMQELRIYPSAGIAPWPDGFCDVTYQAQLRLL